MKQFRFVQEPDVRQSVYHTNREYRRGRLFLDETDKADIEMRTILPRLVQKGNSLTMDQKAKFFITMGRNHFGVILKNGLALAYSREKPALPCGQMTKLSERALFLYFNHFNNTLIVFYACLADYPSRTLRLRIVPLANIVNNSWNTSGYKKVGDELERLILPYPGFLDLSTPDRVYVVWNEVIEGRKRKHLASYRLKDYSFCFHVSDGGVENDFRFTRDSITMLRVKNPRRRAGENIDPSGDQDMEPMMISIVHLSKDSGELQRPLHCNMMKDNGKITFLEEYNRFFIFKQAEGPLTIIDLRKWIKAGDLDEATMLRYATKNWAPRSVSFLPRVNRFICMVGNELQVWQLGPSLDNFGCLWCLTQNVFALQSFKINHDEVGIFFLFRRSQAIGSYAEVWNLAEGIRKLGTVRDGDHSATTKPLTWANTDNFIVAKYCQQRKQLLIAYDDMVFIWDPSEELPIY